MKCSGFGEAIINHMESTEEERGTIHDANYKIPGDVIKRPADFWQAESKDGL